MPRCEITRPATLPALLERCGGAEAARGAAGGTGSASGTGFCTEARLPLRLVPGLCPAPREASAPPARSKRAGRVTGRLISCLGIVFLLRNHCPVLHSRLWRSRWRFLGFLKVVFFFLHFECSASVGPPASKPDSHVCISMARARRSLKEQPFS